MAKKMFVIRNLLRAVVSAVLASTVLLTTTGDHVCREGWDTPQKVAALSLQITAKKKAASKAKIVNTLEKPSAKKETSVEKKTGVKKEATDITKTIVKKKTTNNKKAASGKRASAKKPSVEEKPSVKKPSVAQLVKKPSVKKPRVTKATPLRKEEQLVKMSTQPLPEGDLQGLQRSGDFLEKKILGKGTYGKASLVQHYKSGALFAKKELLIKNPNGVDQEKLTRLQEDLKYETDIIRAVRDLNKQSLLQNHSAQSLQPGGEFLLGYQYCGLQSTVQSTEESKELSEDIKQNDSANNNCRSLGFLTEVALGGDLSDFLDYAYEDGVDGVDAKGQSNTVGVRNTVSLELARLWIAELLLGLGAFHDELGYVHRDIKPKNILVQQSKGEDL
jgi:hypothetical protein